MTQRSRIYQPDKEHEVLLRCIRIFFGSENKERLIELVADDLDLTYLIRSASKNRIIPILFSSLNFLGFPGIPQEIIDELRIDFNDNALKNLATTGELLRILSLFELHGISSISFKGPVLASCIYGDLSLRQFDDIDIIVPFSKIHEIAAILISEGYKEEDHQTSKAQQAAMLKYQHHHKFYNENNGVVLEIHWTLSPGLYSLQREMTNIWERAERIVLQGREILGLSNEDTLLFLCEHGARHRWNRLGWICDVAAILRSGNLDWKYVKSHARERRSERTLFIGLFLAKRLLGASIPDEFSNVIEQDKKALALASEAIVNLCLHGHAPENCQFDPVQCNIQDQLFYINASDRVLDRARLYWRMATTPTIEDWSFLPLPDRIFFLYRLIRPIRQATAHGQKIANWLFR